MKYKLPPSYLWTFVFLLACWLPLQAQVAIGSAGAARESFNAIASGTALPAHWKMSAAGQGANATWSGASNATTLTGAAHSGSPATGGRYNWGTAEGTDRAVGFMSDGSYSSPNAILVRYQNKTGVAVSSFTVTFQVERYRINASPFSLAFFTSSNDVTYTARSEGAISSAVFAGGASAYDFTTPQTVYKTFTITENIPVDGSIYLRWVFTSTGNASQGLGLDNVTLSLNTTTPAVSATLTDALTTDVNNNSKANEGDKLTYTTTISSTGKDASNVQYNAPLDANTTLSGTVKTSAIAIEDNFATPINTPLTGANVSSNDFGLPAKTVVNFGTTEFAVVHLAGSAGTTDNGGTLTVHANGSFAYTPPAGFTGYDRFSYALQAGVAPNDVATVTIAVGNPPSAGEGESFPGVIGNVIVNNAPSLLSNDAGDGLKVCAVNNNPALVGTATTASSGGGNLTINGDGTFTYNPAPGYTGPVQFTYTIDNGFSTPQTVTVNLTISGMIWFVNNTAAAGGDGRFNSPFNSLAGVSNGSGGSGDNQTIFVYSGSGNYTGGIILKNGQNLIGQGATATLESLAGVTIPAYSPALPSTGGSNPVIENAAGNGLTLGSGNTLQGFNLGNASAIALSGVNFGTLTVSEVGINTTGGAIGLTTGTLVGNFTGITSTGGTNNVSFATVNSSSAINLGSGTMSGATGSAFNVTGGNISLTYAGNMTHTSAVANTGVMSVASHTGTITVSGTLNATGYVGLQFLNANGNYNINGTTTASGNQTHGILIQNSSGTFTFGSGTSVSNGGVNGLLFLDGSPNITYSGSVTKSTGSGNLVRFSGVTAGTVTFQTGTLNASSGGGIILSNADGTANFNGTTTLNGGDAHLEVLAGSSSTISFASTSQITNPGNGVLIKVNASTANLTFAGTLSRGGSAQTHAIDVQSNTGGTITLSRANIALSSTATASAGNSEVVYFNGNTGNTTLAFTGGGLNITSNGNGGLVASNTGIANATLKVQGTGNIISSTTGTALSVTQTTIGTPAASEGGLNFKSISANGAPNGIVLNNTGSSGGLKILGDGSTTNSGGIIQNTTSDGISLTSTSNVSFDRIRVANTGGDGISGSAVHGFNLTNSTIFGAGDGDEENAIIFGNDNVNIGTVTTLGVDGIVLIQDVVIDGNNDGTQWGLRVYNNDNAATLNMTLRRLTVQNNVFTFGEQGASIISYDGTANVLVDDCDFLNTDGMGIHGNAGDSSPGEGAVLNLTIQNSTFLNNLALPSAVNFTTSGDGIGRIKINNNTITETGTGTSSTAIDMDASINSKLDAIITNNVMNNIGLGSGVEFIVNENAVGRADIRDNTVNLVGSGQVGMNFQVRNVPASSNQTGTMDLTLKHNIINGMNPGAAAVAGFQLLAGASGTGAMHPNRLTVNLSTAHNAGDNEVNGTNNSALIPPFNIDFVVRQRLSSTFQLQGYGGVASDANGVANFFHTNNPDGNFGNDTNADVFIGSGSNHITNYTSGTAALPIMPTLPPL